jgi:hypothetical protein
MARLAGIISPTVVYALYDANYRIPLAFFTAVCGANLVNIWFAPEDKTGKPLDGAASSLGPKETLLDHVDNS